MSEERRKFESEILHERLNGLAEPCGKPTLDEHKNPTAG